MAVERCSKYGGYQSSNVVSVEGLWLQRDAQSMEVINTGMGSVLRDCGCREMFRVWKLSTQGCGQCSEIVERCLKYGSYQHRDVVSVERLWL